MPPAYSILTDSVFRFVMGAGLAGGVMWKVSSMM